MKTTHDSNEQTAKRCGTKKASNDDRITVAKYYFHEIYWNKIGTAFNTPKRDEKCTQKISWNRTDHLEELNIGERAIMELHWS